MGRHTMVNPTTGRTIFKTGKLGRKVQKMQSMKNRKTATSGRVKSKPKAKAKTSAKKSYHYPCATKRSSPLKKRTKQGGTRPSARANYDLGKTGSVYYNGKVHVMAFKSNGSPYYKPKKTCTTDS